MGKGSAAHLVFPDWMLWKTLFPENPSRIQWYHR